MQMKEIQAARYQFFRVLYERSCGDTTRRLCLAEIGRDLWLELPFAIQIAEHLQHEGLLNWSGTGGGVTITHAGVQQVEAAEADPDRPTRCFPPVSELRDFQHINDESTKTAIEHAAADLSLEPEQVQLIRELLDRILQAVSPLPDSEQNDLLADVAATGVQLDELRPSWAVIATGLASIRSALALHAGAARDDLMSIIDWVGRWANGEDAALAGGDGAKATRLEFTIAPSPAGNIYRARIHGGWLVARHVTPIGTLLASDLLFVPDAQGAGERS